MTANQADIFSRIRKIGYLVLVLVTFYVSGLFASQGEWRKAWEGWLVCAVFGAVFLELGIINSIRIYFWAFNFVQLQLR